MRGNKIFLILILIIICACNDVSKQPASTSPRYSYDEIPPINCQDQSLFCAVWAERYGYEASIHIGNLDGGRHAQARMTDFDGNQWWLHFNGFKPPAWSEQIDGWEPDQEMDIDTFLLNIRKWSIQNNFYRQRG